MGPYFVNKKPKEKFFALPDSQSTFQFYTNHLEYDYIDKLILHKSKGRPNSKLHEPCCLVHACEEKEERMSKQNIKK